MHIHTLISYVFLIYIYNYICIYYRYVFADMIMYIYYCIQYVYAQYTSICTVLQVIFKAKAAGPHFQATGTRWNEHQIIM